MNAAGPDSLYVDLFIGSTVKIDPVAGSSVRMEQATDNPWNDKVALTAAPVCEGITSLAITGTVIMPVMSQGYAVLTRDQHSGCAGKPFAKL